MTERRKYQRFDIYCPLEYRGEDGLLADSSMSLNLSEGGALISTKNALEQGMRLIVKIKLHGLAFFLRSRVAHVQHGIEGVYSAGIEFLDASADFVRRYYGELEAVLFYQKQCSDDIGYEIPLPVASMQWFSSSTSAVKSALR